MAYVFEALRGTNKLGHMIMHTILLGSNILPSDPINLDRITNVHLVVSGVYKCTHIRLITVRCRASLGIYYFCTANVKKKGELSIWH